MWSLLRNLHRFFVNQLFYPLVLSSLLAMAIFTGRVLLSHSLEFDNLPWNLFLAWVPYLFSLLAVTLQRLFPRQWLLLVIPVGLWLIFYPNAAYIVTDFLHLEQRPGIPLWYDILLLAAFSWTGMFLAIASLGAVQGLVKEYLGSFAGWLFAAIALGLSGLGIYLGRFGRWNSWDLLFQPKNILKDIALALINPFENRTFFGFTILITAFLVVCYLMFISVRQSKEPDL
ncbi:MAG TPA: DUF1361 domain-containing protein [Anaerolineales bacterium]